LKRLADLGARGAVFDELSLVWWAVSHDTLGYEKTKNANSFVRD
jgi:hypothetical protein